MTAATLTAIDDQEVLYWRFTQLLGAGYSADQAVELACHGDVDLHLAVDLPARGCPTQTAVHILL
jgi:hypothetical protein